MYLFIFPFVAYTDLSFYKQTFSYFLFDFFFSRSPNYVLGESQACGKDVRWYLGKHGEPKCLTSLVYWKKNKFILDKMFFEEKCLHAANIFGKIVSFKLIHQSSANCVVIFCSGE